MTTPLSSPACHPRTARAVVFDLDDTLYPEEEFVRSGFRAVASWAGARLSLSTEVVGRELDALFDSGVRGDTFDLWLRARGAPDAFRDEMIHVYRNHVPSIRVFADVLPALESLRGRVRLGLVTDGDAVTQRQKLRALGLQQWFDTMIVSGDLGPASAKPSPDCFREVLSRLDVAARAAAYVGDNPAKDFIGARAAGLWTVRVRRPNTLYGALEPARAEFAPDAEIAGLGELDAAIPGLRLP
jgi:putative hydrolase of the HAD superfamily